MDQWTPEQQQILNNALVLLPAGTPEATIRGLGQHGARVVILNPLLGPDDNQDLLAGLRSNVQQMDEALSGPPATD